MKRDNVASTGPDNGSTMRNNTPQLLLPSIFADSSKPPGSPRKKVRKIIMFHTLMIPGMTSTQNVFIRPSSRTSKNEGISPPLKYIVTMHMIM
ncbi:hypothetical protein D3C76_1699770 [compost metagenome]